MNNFGDTEMELEQMKVLGPSFSEDNTKKHKVLIKALKKNEFGSSAYGPDSLAESLLCTIEISGIACSSMENIIPKYKTMLVELLDIYRELDRDGYDFTVFHLLWFDIDVLDLYDETDEDYSNYIYRAMYTLVEKGNRDAINFLVDENEMDSDYADLL